jgi:O-antigen ligase
MPLVARAIPDDAQAMWNLELPIPGSTFHRLVIWRFTADRIAERPLLGWGFEASREIPGGKAMFALRRTNSRTGREEKIAGGMLPLHPHDGILQVWLELGALGAALLAALIVAILAAIGRMEDRFARAGALGTCVGGYVIFCVSYGVWQNWWLASLWLVATLVTALSRTEAARRSEATAERAALRA